MIQTQEERTRGAGPPAASPHTPAIHDSDRKRGEGEQERVRLEPLLGEGWEVLEDLVVGCRRSEDLFDVVVPKCESSASTDDRGEEDFRDASKSSITSSSETFRRFNCRATSLVSMSYSSRFSSIGRVISC